MSDEVGTVAFVGGGEFGAGLADLDAELIERVGAAEVLVLPTAAAFEHPQRTLVAAETHFGALGVKTRGLEVMARHDIDEAAVSAVDDARFIYLGDGSPLHLRSVLKGSALYEAIESAYRSGAVIAASGAGATLLGDPMVDPRGGAYTVGLGLVANLAVFPYHGSAADHLRERSIDLLPSSATLVGIDEATALVRDPDGTWRVGGVGTATLYGGDTSTTFASGAAVDALTL